MKAALFSMSRRIHLTRRPGFCTFQLSAIFLSDSSGSPTFSLEPGLGTSLFFETYSYSAAREFLYSSGAIPVSLRKRMLK